MNTGDQNHPNSLVYNRFLSRIRECQCYNAAHYLLRTQLLISQSLLIRLPAHLCVPTTDGRRCSCCLQTIHRLVHWAAQECWPTARPEHKCPLNRRRRPSLSKNSNLSPWYFASAVSYHKICRTFRPSKHLLNLAETG